MVILVKRFGQLGNRLFLFAHLVANAAEYGYAVDPADAPHAQDAHDFAVQVEADEVVEAEVVVAG